MQSFVNVQEILFDCSKSLNIDGNKSRRLYVITEESQSYIGHHKDMNAKTINEISALNH